MHHKISSITHINSYFIASPVHAELVAALDGSGLSQNVFVPVQKAGHLGRNEPVKLNNSEIAYDHCFNTADRYLWPLKMQKTWTAFKKFHQRHPAILIHAHTLIVNGLIAYLAWRKWGIPYIVTIRKSDLKFFLKYLPFFSFIGLKIMQNAKHVVAVSPAYRNMQLPQYFSQDNYQAIIEKCTVVPNGINDFWIQNRYHRTKILDYQTIIFAGRLDKNKNIHALIKACEILSTNNVSLKLVVAGNGPLLSALRKKKLNFPAVFHGQITQREQLLQLYRQADVLVVPSREETFGLVYPEAMSQGLPVLYSKGQGFDGFFAEGHVGYAVDPDSPHDIAEKIRRVFSDYIRISTNAYEASKIFSWDRVSSKLTYIYQSVIYNA